MQWKLNWIEQKWIGLEPVERNRPDWRQEASQGFLKKGELKVAKHKTGLEDEQWLEWN